MAAVSPTEPVADLLRTRRCAALVAAIAGLVLPVWVFVTQVVVGEGYRGDIPGVDEPAKTFVPWIADNFTRIRVVAVMGSVIWIILLVFLVALVRLTTRQLDIAGMVAVALAAASTAVGVAGRGVFASATMVWELNEKNLAANLDPGVARWMVLSVDVSGNFAGMLFGASLVALGIQFLRSDVFARRFLGITALLIGGGAVINPVFGGGESPTSLLGALWPIVTAILLLVFRRRTRPVEAS